jgi:4-amino-4-deoxy-L-arabinose transferase-like glycosyltransferase
MKSTLKSHWPLILLSSIYLILFFATAGRYGIFRDELYYIACARDLAWGYVDHPPFSLVILRLVLVTLGDSVVAIRTVAALSGVVCMIFTWNLTRNLGGDRFAASLAILAWFGNLMFLALTNFFSMNALDLVFWLAGFLVVTVWIRSQNPKWWIGLGLVVGLGLEQIQHGILGLEFWHCLAHLFTSKRITAARSLAGRRDCCDSLFAAHHLADTIRLAQPGVYPQCRYL